MKTAQLTAALLVIASCLASGATYTYNATANGTWSTGSNWAGGSAPLSSNTTTLTFGGATLAASANITATNDIAAPPFQLNSLNVTYAGGSNATATVNLAGNQLDFRSNGATTPTIVINTSNTFGTIKPTTTIGNNILLTNNTTLNATTIANFTGVISGAGSLTITPSGGTTGNAPLTISGLNTYTGNTTITSVGGAYQSAININSLADAGVASSLGAGDAINVTNISYIKYIGSGTASTNRTINITGSYSYLTLLANTGTSFTLNGTVNVPVNGSLDVRANTTINGVVAGLGSVGFSVTGGNLTLTASNTFTGNLSVSEGSVYISSIADTGTSSNAGSGGFVNLGSTITTGRLVYTGTGNTTNRTVNLAGATGGAVLDQSGNGTLTFTSNFTATGGGAKTLTLQGSTAGTGVIQGVIKDSSSGATSLTKNGTGTWTLSGTNTYTGNTTVTAGTLIISGSTSAAAAWRCFLAPRWRGQAPSMH